MKHLGSALEFTRQRNDALYSTYKQLIADTRHIRLNHIARQLVNSPSPRFWVSEERATAVVSAIMRGKPILATMRPTKREMFEEIHRRVIAIKQTHPDATLCQLVAEVICSPAPKFYMEPSSALERLFKIRKSYYGKNKFCQSDHKGK